MIYRRWHTMAIMVMVLALVLAACASEVTPEPTEEPAATEEVADVTEEADVEDTDTEATEAADVEDTDAEATEVVDAESVDTEVTEVADAESVDVEATEDADMDTDVEATDEADMDSNDMDAEATQDADMDSNDMGSDDMAELVSADDLGLPYNFEYPSDFEANVNGNTDTVTLSNGDQKVTVIGPAAYTSVVGSREFASDIEQLGFFLDRAGYDVGDESDMAMGIGSLSIALPRTGQVGFGNLIDLENGRRGVVIELGPDEDNTPGAVGTVIMGSIVYPPDLADVAASTENISTFVAAAEAIGLDLHSDEYTVFAPTDDAFAAAAEALGLSAEELLADTETLAEIVNYHLVESTMLAEDVVALDGEDITTVNGATIAVAMSDDGVTLADANGNVVNVVTTDITASNGVIHIIDGVLMPPVEEADSEEADSSEEVNTEEMTLPTIVGAAIGNEDLSTLATAIVRAGLVGDLNGEGSFTVFAPTNEAFAAAEIDMTDREALTSVMTYHVVDGAAMSGDLEDGQELTTLNGATLTIAVSDEGITVTDGSGNTYNVVTADVEASNGVIHIIDGVLMPPSGD
ncbi:MAG: fasciclin domain-containing protein [Anaerolineae bacterium]|nr:fasciclin domain-containing protein [Anaerolineae bacterium]